MLLLPEFVGLALYFALRYLTLCFSITKLSAFRKHIPGSYIRKIGEVPMETRSCINGSHVKDDEPHGFGATEQISLSRSTLTALAVLLRFLRKQDLDMYCSVNSSLLID